MKLSALKELEKFERDTEQCMKCGFCTYVCPVYQAEKIESGVARGKNELAKALLNGDLELNRNLADRLYKCTACMACTENCPSKAPIPRIVVAARADVVRTMGVRFPYGFAYRNLLANRKLLGNFLRFGGFLQSALMPAKNGTIRHLPGFMSALTKGRNLPAIAPKFLREQVDEVIKPPRGMKSVMRIGYFPGCMHEFALPHIGIKTIDLLTRHGIEVVMPRDQACCGAAAFLGAGDFETGRKVADINVAAFRDVDCIVTGCATCACTLREYPHFPGGYGGKKRVLHEVFRKHKTYLSVPHRYSGTAGLGISNFCRDQRQEADVARSLPSEPAPWSEGATPADSEISGRCELH
jgi:glycolate oxidase iron-sulfur subunit